MMTTGRAVLDPEVVQRHIDLADLYNGWPGGDAHDDPDFVAEAQEIMGLPPLEGEVDFPALRSELADLDDDEVVRALVHAFTNMVERRFDPSQRRAPAGTPIGGEWIRDLLRLADRIDLGEGETFAGSDVIEGNDSDLLAAVVDSAAGRHVRLGLGIASEDRTRWRAADKGSTVDLDETAQHRLAGVLDEMQAATERRAAAGRAAERRIESLEDQRAQVLGRQYSLDRDDARELAQAQEQVALLDERLRQLVAEQDDRRRRLAATTDPEDERFLRGMVNLRDGDIATARSNRLALAGTIADLTGNPRPLTPDEQATLTRLDGDLKAANDEYWRHADTEAASGVVPAGWGDIVYSADVADDLSISYTFKHSTDADISDGVQFDSLAKLRKLLAGQVQRSWILRRRDFYGDAPGERVAPGRKGGGRFRKLTDRLTDLLEEWVSGEGPDDPLDEFSRDQLRKTTMDLGAKARAAGDDDRATRLTPRRGASSDEIKLALYTDIRASRRGDRDVPEGRPEPRKAAAPKLSDDPDVRAVQVENRIRAAYRDAVASSGRRDLIPLADIRDRLADLDRAEVDAALTRMARNRAAGVVLTPNEDRKRRTARDREAALRVPGYGSEDVNGNDWLTIDDPSPLPEPRKVTPAKKAAPRAPDKPDVAIPRRQLGLRHPDAETMYEFLTGPKFGFGAGPDVGLVGGDRLILSPDVVDRLRLGKPGQNGTIEDTANGPAMWFFGDLLPLRGARVASKRAPTGDQPDLSTLDDDPEALRDALDLKLLPELKKMLKERKLPVSGRKRELVDRLVEHRSGGSDKPAAKTSRGDSLRVTRINPLRDGDRVRWHDSDGNPIEGTVHVLGNRKTVIDWDGGRREQVAAQKLDPGVERISTGVATAPTAPTDPEASTQTDEQILSDAQAELARLTDTRGLTGTQAGDRAMLANRERARLRGAQARIEAAKPRPDDPVERGKWLAAHGDVGRDVAGSLSMLDELTHNGASAKAVESRLKTAGYGMHPDVVAELTEAGVSRDPAKVAAAIDRVAAAYGLTRVGAPAGGVEPLDPTTHEMLGDLPAPPTGTFVRVVRPGYYADIDGRRVVLTKSVVDAADPDEIGIWPGERAGTNPVGPG